VRPSDAIGRALRQGIQQAHADRIFPAPTRREVLRWGLLGGPALVLPSATLLGCGDEDAPPAPIASSPAPTPVPRFLTSEELATLRAMTGRIVPTDERPGALEAGAANYIDRLLSIVPDDNDPAGTVFGGGPFSDRNPFPDPATGTPSTRLPANNFRQFIPLTRLQRLSWQVRLLGSATVPGGDFNDGVLRPIVGLRDRYRTGLAAVQSKSMDMFGAVFAGLASQQQDRVLAATDGAFVELVTGHTLEGMFCAPEYGGNTDRIGWQLIGYDGDSQPLGYSIFDEGTMSYRERADKPNSTADPDEDFSGVDATTQQFLRLLVRIVGGPHFP